MKDKIAIYLAGGWFSQNQNEVLTMVEDHLAKIDYVNTYRPRHDGVKLEANQFHDHTIREKVFQDNIQHIDEADLVVACCDGRDGYYDQGTQWEIGYAMSKGTPVIALDTTDVIDERFSAIKIGLHIVHTLEELSRVLSKSYSVLKDKKGRVEGNKVLFVGPDDTEEQKEINQDIVSTVILDCQGSEFRWLYNLKRDIYLSYIDEIFDDVQYVVAVIDDRHPIVSWIIGQAYERNIPVVTYTNNNYGINLMLNCSLLTHCKGKEELKRVMQKIKRTGISSIPKYDDSNIKVY